ncbi:hypothetical protein CRQ31_25200, partial [Salmonella enterica subsp. enterica serovar Worthington]|nr:hypothetical protein [Salmonella enterica subsp. enterica serovar Worthington]
MMNGNNDLTANRSYGRINMYGERATNIRYDTVYYLYYAGITWKNRNALSANNMDIQGIFSGEHGIGMQFGDFGAYRSADAYAANVTFDGNVSLTARAQRSGYGFYYAHSFSDSNARNILTFNNGTASINAVGGVAFTAGRNTLLGTPIISRIHFVLNNASLNIAARNTSITDAVIGSSYSNITIRGQGNVSLTGSSVGSGAGVNMTNVNVNNLNGSLNISGQSSS